MFKIKNMCVKIRITVFPLEELRIFNYSLFFLKKNEDKLALYAFKRPSSLPNCIMCNMRKAVN